MKPIEEIAERIEEVVVVARAFDRSGATVVDAANAASEAAGYRNIGDGWQTIDNGVSLVEHVAYYIGHNLAYTGYQLLPVDECIALAEDLLRHADPGATWVTNASPDASGTDGLSSYSWTPVSDWTFDMAIVGVGHARTVFICFFAED